MISTAAAVLLALFFAVAGIWKLVNPIDFSARLVQLKVPGELALPASVLLGITETFAAALLFVPRFRRWGAWIAGALLLLFMGYMAINYEELIGADCSCFPWLKRTVGPVFFYTDAIMVAGAVLAGLWARRSQNLRGAFIVLIAIAVFGGASFGVDLFRQTGAKAPDTIQVAGQPVSIQEGKVFLYFFDPECMHCFEAAQRLSTHNWKGVRLIAVPTRMPQFAQNFLNDTGLKAELSSDVDLLKSTFPFGDPPFAVLLENGRQQSSVIVFDEKQPADTLRQLDFIE